MDINRIDKIADRRRLLEDVDKIQAKISKENKEILKIQIGQDCAFWDQKQKLADVKGEHERLQQNMLQLQMQYEELSSKYEAELRTRPELINKLNHTRMMVDELEKAMQRCIEQGARGKKEREALVELYAEADRTVCSLKQQYVTILEQAKSRADELQLKLKKRNEQHEQLTEKYQDSQIQLHTLKNLLEAARSDHKELSASTEDVKKKLEAANLELHQREAAISNLQRELRNLATNIHNQLAEAKNILLKKDNDLKSAAEEIESLKKALSNQEEFTKMQCDRNNEMLEKLALVEEQHQQAETSNHANKKKLEEMTSMCENFKNNMLKLKDENEAQTRELGSKQQLLNAYIEELESYKQHLLDYDFKLDKVTLELNKTAEESENKNKLIKKLETEVETVNKTLSETQNDFKNYREEAEEKLKSLAETIEEKCHEIEIHNTATMQANKELQSEKEERAKLVVELQNTAASLEVKTAALTEEKEARAKIESDLVNLKRDFEIELATLKEQLKENVSQLEAGMRAKDEEHSRELADVIKRRNDLEMEKKALEDVIKGLEQRIINIREVASQTQAERSNFQPTPDENAVEDWVLSTCREANRREGVETDENAMMILPHIDSLQADVFNYFSGSEDSLRLRSQPATKERHFAWASKMRSAREASPTPAAIQRARDAPYAAAQARPIPPPTKMPKQARHDTPATSRATGCNDAAAAAQARPIPPPTKMPKQARHDTPATSRATGCNDAAAADAGTVDCTAKPRRFFKTARNRSKI